MHNIKTSISPALLETCNYFFPRILFLQTQYAAQTHWGDITLALNNFPTEIADLKSEFFWTEWMNRWRRVADAYLNDSYSLETPYLKARALRSATAAYHWAEFMFFSQQDLKTLLRKKAKQCFTESLKLSNLNVEMGELFFNNISMPYYFILPIGNIDKKVPCVIFSNGLDSISELEIFALAEFFIFSGFSVFIFDGPGQGINVGINPINLEFENVIEFVINELKQFAIIDFKALIFFGISFGGYFSLRVAKYLGHYFNSIINLSGGPALNSFDTLPRRLKQDFQFVFMENDSDKMQAKFDSLALSFSDSVCKTKIFSIHGMFDDIFPVDAVFNMDKVLGSSHKLHVYSNEAHVCLNYINIYLNQIIRWVKECIKV